MSKGVSFIGLKLIGWSGGALAIVLMFYAGYRLLLDALRLPGDGEPCIRVEEANSLFRPIQIGQSVSLKVGGVSGGSDCVGTVGDATAWTWSTNASNVVQIAADGTLTAIGPGRFQITASQGQKSAGQSGIVWPKDVKLSVHPSEATVTVGNSVKLRLEATDAAGKSLPLMGHFFHTVNYQKPTGASGPNKEADPEPRFFDRNFYSSGGDPVTFKALRPGKTTITARMGEQTIAVPVTIVPPPPR